MNVAFPLRDGYFRPLRATLEDQTRWKDHVQQLVQRSLVEERPYFTGGYDVVDRRQWKLVRRKDQLRVFSPRAHSTTASASHAPCLLEIGTIEGTLEDVIYGVHHVTSQDMRATTSFLSADALDSAVLHVFENGNDHEHDPFRSFALKWRILETPAGSLVKNRDVCAFEYMGIATDSDGVPYAFHICESFDHPVCPPFHTQCVVRAKTQTCIIYRQLRPGRVGVYYRGEYTTGGRIPNFLARWTAAEVAVSISRSVECAEAKKLTTMALAGSTSSVHDLVNGRRLTPKRERVRSMGASRSCAICDHALAPKALQTCQTCGSAVCSKCRTRKHLLSDEGKILVVCCKQCIVAARDLRVDPRQPLGLVSAAYWHAHGIILSASAHAPASSSAQGPKTMPTGISPTRSTPDALAHSHDDVEEDDDHRPRAWTIDQDFADILTSSSRQRAYQRVRDKQKAREDVYELLAGMSVTSESTVASTVSRDEASLFLSGSLDEEDYAGAFDSQPVVAVATIVATGSSPSPPRQASGPLWHQIRQLRLTAEQTYRQTKQQGDEWVRR